MKKLFILIVMLATFQAYAQREGDMSYQGVFYEASTTSSTSPLTKRKPFADKPICLQFSFYDTKGEVLIYSEKVVVKTNKYGMVSLKIGGNTKVEGEVASFEFIDWSVDHRKLKVEVDKTGGCSGYELVSFDYVGSVPYSLVSENAKGITGTINKAQAGLGNVDNTADKDKPLSDAQKTAIDAKVNSTSVAANINDFPTSDTNVPSTKAVKDYVANEMKAGSVADFGIITMKLANYGVTDIKVATDAITTDKIKNANVTDDKIASISATKITTGTIDYGRLPSLAGATSSTVGVSGIVPVPQAGDQDKLLAGDGTWRTVNAGGEKGFGLKGTMPTSGSTNAQGVLQIDPDWMSNQTGSVNSVTFVPLSNSTGLSLTPFAADATGKILRLGTVTTVDTSANVILKTAVNITIYPNEYFGFYLSGGGVVIANAPKGVLFSSPITAPVANITYGSSSSTTYAIYAYTIAAQPVMSPMLGATSANGGGSGIVPKPLAGEQGKVLYGDATWKAITTLPGVVTAATAASYTNTDQLATTAFVIQNNNPPGTIIDWYGGVYSLATPAGYWPCDGTTINAPGSLLHGKIAPDLRDIVLAGVAVSKVAGDTVGNNDLMLTQNNLPNVNLSGNGSTTISGTVSIPAPNDKLGNPDGAYDTSAGTDQGRSYWRGNGAAVSTGLSLSGVNLSINNISLTGGQAQVKADNRQRTMYVTKLIKL